MEPLTTPGHGAWLEELIDPAWRDMHAVVPRGFQAYARIFHPVTRDRPADTKSWHLSPADSFVDFDSEEVRWAEVARTFGTVMHPQAQFHRLVGRSIEAHGQGFLDSDGWRYTEPEEGNLDIGVLASTAVQLCRHTTTPGSGIAAIWEGWGGLTSPDGYTTLTIESFGGEPDDVIASAQDPTAALLPADVVNGPKLDLPHRSYFLFAVPPVTFTDPAWANVAPWHHAPWSPQSPSIIWPADRAWVVVSEIDFDSTVIAGSHSLINDLVADPGIEALRLREGSDLTWDADVENRPTP